jgi:glucoamylase
MPGEGSTDGGATLHAAGASLAEWMDRQYGLSAAAMLQSISAVHLVKERPGFGQTIRPARGSVLASPVIAAYDPDPDYFFHWLRDSAVVIDAVRTLIEGGAGDPGLHACVEDFIRFSLALGDLDGRAVVTSGGAGLAPDPKFQQYMRPTRELSEAFGGRISGETRFNPDGTLDVTKWARPQHDGPALRALAMLRFWPTSVFDEDEARDAARRLIEADLAFTHRHWRKPSFDIWEEESGHHYYTRLVQQAALADGAQWFVLMGDAQRAGAYWRASREIADELDGHWDAGKGFYLSRIGVAAGSSQKELDIAVILAVIHARRQDGPHSVSDPKAQATLARLEHLFAGAYPINRSLPGDRGAAMGRYQGDVYYSGGAYYFSTLAAAEFFFSLAGAVARRIRTNSLSPDDLSSIKALVGAEQALNAPGAFDALLKRGDSFMATVRAYTPASGDLSEQFDGATGQQTSAKNLAWSHAAFITAVAARRAALRARV